MTEYEKVYCFLLKSLYGVCTQIDYAYWTNWDYFVELHDDCHLFVWQSIETPLLDIEIHYENRTKTLKAIKKILRNPLKR